MTRSDGWARRWRGGKAAAVLTCALGGAAPLSAQEEAQAPPVAAVEIEIGGRVQTQWNTTSVDGETPSELFLRRARLEMDVRVNDLVSGNLDVDFAGDRAVVKDAYLQIELSPALAVRAGRAYRPFSLLENTSSLRILPIERGLAIRGVDAYDQYALVHDLDYADRDDGIQILGAPPGAPLGLTYQAGVFAGPLAGAIGDRQSYQLAARATVAPLERLRVGAGWSARGFARAVLGEVELERGHAFEVDLEYGAFAPGPHLLAELSAGDFDPFAGRGFLGAHAWLGYRTQPLGVLSAVEPILRLSHGDVDAAAGAPEPGGTLVTPGLNLYFGGWNRVMVNYDLWRGAGGTGSQRSLRTQFQLAF